MKTMNKQLTLQQQRFCDEYLVSFNAFQSALKAGYSESTARKCGLLHLPKVQAYLQDAMKRTSERLEITHDMILREFAKVAFASIGDYYDENGILKPINQLTPDEQAALACYQVTNAADGSGKRGGGISCIKLYNKLTALDKIARHTGFYLAGSRKRDAGTKMTTPQAGEPESREVGEDSPAEIRRQINEYIDALIAAEEAGLPRSTVKPCKYVEAEVEGSRESEVLSFESGSGSCSGVLEERRESVVLSSESGSSDVALERVMPDENILTLSTPVGMPACRTGGEDGKCNPDSHREEDMADENILTLSPPAKVEPKKGKWSPVSAASIVCATVSCR